MGKPSNGFEFIVLADISALHSVRYGGSRIIHHRKVKSHVWASAAPICGFAPAEQMKI
jgi:hypothetical protein